MRRPDERVAVGHVGSYGHGTAPEFGCEGFDPVEPTREKRDVVSIRVQGAAGRAPVPEEAPVMTGTRGNFWESDILITFPFSSSFHQGKLIPAWASTVVRTERGNTRDLMGREGVRVFLPPWPQIHTII